MVIVAYRIFEHSVFNDILYDDCHYFIQVSTWFMLVVHGEKYLYTVHFYEGVADCLTSDRGVSGSGFTTVLCH